MKKGLIILMLCCTTISLFAEWEEFGVFSGESVWASSSLLEPVRYGPENLFDTDPAKPWVEGVPGSGEGETLTILTQRGITGLEITNGFAVSQKLFLKNNRVKKARISLVAGFTAPGMVSEFDSTVYMISELPIAEKLNFEDSPKPQSFPILLPVEKQYEFDLNVLTAFRKANPVLFTMMLEELEIPIADAEEPLSSMLILEIYGFFGLRITLEDVYRGSHWDDTCISEIKVSIEEF